MTVLVWGCGFPGVAPPEGDRANASSDRPGREARREPSDADRRAIERVLQADQEAGEGRPGARQVARTIARIDLSDVPPDFRRAYERHVDAWREAADLADDVDRLIDPTSEVQTRMGRRLLEAENRITATFDQVGRIAMSYEAAPPEPRR